MQEKIYISWKRIILASTISILLTFFMAFVIAVLCSCYLITVKTGNILMFAGLFIGSFIGLFCIKAPSKRILYVLASALLTFVLLQMMGMLMPHDFSAKNTVYVLAVLLLSSIANSIVSAMVRR